jgi:arsenate reductase
MRGAGTGSRVSTGRERAHDSPMKITVYEKPTCTTCRNLNKLFESKGIDWKKVNYFIEPFTEQKLSSLLEKTGMKPFDMLRRAEPDYKLADIDKNSPDKEVIAAMVKYPSIIQRPIVEVGDRAVLARPIEKALEILDAG